MALLDLRRSLAPAGAFIGIVVAAVGTGEEIRNARPAWTSSRIHGTPEPPPPLKTRRVYPHLAFQEPTELAVADGLNRIFVTERLGRVFSFPDDDSCRQADLFVDGNELVARLAQRRDEDLVFHGLFGIAFPPDFADTRFCYLCYAARHKDRTRGQHPEGTRVVRLTVTEDNPPRCDPASEVEILSWLQGGHPGGCLRFGPDGLLYISTADAGEHAPADGHRTGQDVSDLLASILRIDVSGTTEGSPHTIPEDNPLLGIPGARGEIYAYGVRNPWKMSFDRATGDLWAGDVGLEMWEMIYKVRPGDNYGWSVMDGSHPLHPERPRGPTPIVPPLMEISHAEAASITGGFVYRGHRLPEFVGTYIFGDWETRRIWGISAGAAGPGPVRNLVDPQLRVIAFGEKHDGELLIADYDDGTLHELVRNDKADDSKAFPMRLSETGLFTDTAAQVPATGVLPFAVNADAWADHATAQRWIGIEGNGTIGRYSTPELLAGTNFKRVLHFPAGTVLAKTLSMEMVRGDPAAARRIETQVLHYDGITWRGYTYSWNDAQTDAELVPAIGGRIELVVEDAAAPEEERRQTWAFSSRADCVRCHNPWAENALAFSMPQLDRDVEIGGHLENQLMFFERIGLIECRQTGAPRAVTDVPPPRLAALNDASLPLDARARSYLHVNCGHCHRFGGGGSGTLRLNHELPLSETSIVNAVPTQGSFGLDDARIVSAGDPFRSTLFYRTATTGPGRMPHIGSDVVDRDGLALLHDWIVSLPATERSGRPLESTALRPVPPTPTTALRLAWEMDRGTIDATTRDTVLTAVDDTGDAVLAGLFERFLPPNRRQRRLGTQFDATDILKLTGDVERGHLLFTRSATLQCRSCHMIGSEGRTIGPALDGIGRRLAREAIVESLVHPSRVIDPAYRTWIIQTDDGRTVSGIMVSRHEREVVLRDAAGAEICVPAADIDEMHSLHTSLMPEHLLRDLTPLQAADLLAYLQSLR